MDFVGLDRSIIVVEAEDVLLDTREVVAESAIIVEAKIILLDIREVVEAE